MSCAIGMEETVVPNLQTLTSAAQEIIVRAISQGGYTKH